MELKPREELLKDWLAALRSGDYQQGKKRLAVTNEDGTVGYCCLGVLCELAGIEKRDWAGERTYEGSSTLPPRYLAKHIGLRSESGTFIKPSAAVPVSEFSFGDYATKERVPIVVDGASYDGLTVMNDGMDDIGKPALTFAQIADVIEQHADKIFVPQT